MASNVGAPPPESAGWGLKQICSFDKVTWAFGGALIITSIALFILNALNVGSFHTAALATIGTGGGVLLLGLMTHCCLRCPCDEMCAAINETEKRKTTPSSKELPKPIPLEEKETRAFFEEKGIFGLPDPLIKHIDFLRQSRLQENFSIRVDPGMILYGEKGTGKSTIAKAIAELLGGELREPGPGDHLNKYIGETEKNISDLFNVPEGAFRVIIVDEIDGMAPERNNHVPNSGYVSHLLAKFESKDVRPRYLLIGTTNNFEKLDSAFKRSGRAGTHFEILNPDRKVRAKIFKYHFAKLENKSDDQRWIDLHKKLSEDTESFSCSDIVQGVIPTCAKAALIDGDRQITPDDVIEAVSEVAEKIALAKELEKSKTRTLWWN